MKVGLRHSYSFDVQVWLGTIFMDEVDDERPGQGKGDENNQPESMGFAIERKLIVP